VSLSNKSAPKRPRRYYRLGAIAAIAGLGAVFLFFSSQSTDAFVYAKAVDQVVGDPTLVGKGALRVDGNLKPGSVKFREKPCEWRFVMTKANAELNVRYPYCVVPDTFKDAPGVEVTAQGNLQGDGWFIANQLIPRCPSKYERGQRIQRGEQKPHDSN
jgi:cytochrome c-type biogenesis protein CcmE